MDNNNQTQNEEKISLLQKIYAKLHTAKLSKKIIGLVLAGAISLSVISCGTGTSNSNDSTNPDASQSQTQENESKYSQLLQNVLNNEEYNHLINSAKANTRLYDSGEFEPHPFEFLKSQGHNIDKILSGETPCYTMSYVLDDEPNNLYMYTRIQPTNSYYTNYLIKYTLTDQEMDEYFNLHFGKIGMYYVQSVFMNREIAKTKIPTIVGTSNIDKETFDYMVFESKESKPLNIKGDLLLFNPKPNEYKCDMLVIPSFNNRKQMMYNENLATATGIGIIPVRNNIMYGPKVYANFNYVENYNPQEATLFFSQDMPLALTSSKDFNLNN
jgi:hypothetical protein